MQIQKHLPFLILGAILLFFGLAWHRFTQEREAHEPVTRPLVVGTNVGYPPFIITDEHGQVGGFDFEVAREIAESMGRELVVKDMAFDALLLALRQGTVDMVIGGISITRPREQTGMLIPYYGDGMEEVAIFYPQHTPQSAMTLVDAAAHNMLVCTQAGSLFEEILEEYPGVRIKTLPDISDLYLEVMNGACVAGVLDADTTRVLANASEGLAWHTIALPRSQHIGGFGIGVLPHNQPLRRQVETAVAQLKKSKRMKKLATDWF